MKKYPLFIASLLALTGMMLLGPAVRADDKPADSPKAEKKIGPRVLKKYDKNHDGALDDEEKAAWEADKAKRREERKAKKAEGEKSAPDAAEDEGAAEQK